MSITRIEIVLDPPRGIVNDSDHDYVTVTAECSNEQLLTWFMKLVQDYTACQFSIEKTDEIPKCLGVIPGTFIACGEGGNYCRPACRNHD